MSSCQPSADGLLAMTPNLRFGVGENAGGVAARSVAVGRDGRTGVEVGAGAGTAVGVKVAAGLGVSVGVGSGVGNGDGGGGAVSAPVGVGVKTGGAADDIGEAVAGHGVPAVSAVATGLGRLATAVDCETVGAIGDGVARESHADVKTALARTAAQAIRTRKICDVPVLRCD